MHQQHIKERVAHYSSLALEIYEYCTENPELSWAEENTTRYIEAQLDKAEILHYRLVKTGTIAEIKGKYPDSQTFYIRGDIDALPIDDSQTIKRLKSKNPGVAHCCGHGFHLTASLITALIINELRDVFVGRAIIVFQAAEEVLRPTSGAQALIAAGLLERYPNIIGMVGLHATPELSTGKIAIRSAAFMASSSEMKLRLSGKTGHVAQPHNTANVIPMAAEIIQSCQMINTQMANPVIPTLVSFTKIRTFDKEDALNANVIPDVLEMTVAYRTFDEGFRQQIRDKIQQIATSVTINHGGHVEFENLDGIPPVFNSPKLTDWARNQLIDFFGAEAIVEASLRLGGDDVGVYFQEIPGVYLRLGTGNKEKGTDVQLHQPGFQVDEAALPIAIQALSWLSWQALK